MSAFYGTIDWTRVERATHADECRCCFGPLPFGPIYSCVQWEKYELPFCSTRCETDFWCNYSGEWT